MRIVIALAGNDLYVHPHCEVCETTTQPLVVSHCVETQAVSYCVETLLLLRWLQKFPVLKKFMSHTEWLHARDALNAEQVCCHWVG